jgi:hypothetical protein
LQPNTVRFYHFSVRVKCPSHFIILITFYEACKLRSSSLCSYFIILRLRYSLKHSVLQLTQRVSFP